MIESIKHFWYLYLILFILIILTAFVCKKAFGAASRHSKEFNANLAKLKREKELRDAYSELTEEIIASAPADTLFEGTALCMEAKCQKSEDTSAFYLSLSDYQKLIYAYFYLAGDAKKDKLSAFFAQSTKPLTSDALAAAEKILSAQAYAIVKDMHDRYDDDNENASVIPEEIAELDEKFRELTDDINLFDAGG
ncbi:MAG: hypothetical protein UHK54_01775 [Acutalibacteraceae bacterium]|nr:hypothetical protein [Acutalibacteraceae bacterium]